MFFIPILLFWHYRVPSAADLIAPNISYGQDSAVNYWLLVAAQRCTFSPLLSG